MPKSSEAWANITPNTISKSSQIRSQSCKHQGPIPYTKQAKLKEMLEHLQHTDVVAKVDKATDWVSNLVITEKKDGRMRICLSPIDL